MAKINSAPFISIAMILILNANVIAANNSTEYFDEFDDTAGDYCKLDAYHIVVASTKETLRICVQNRPTFAVYDHKTGVVEIQLVETIASELNVNVVYQFADEKRGVCSER